MANYSDDTELIKIRPEILSYEITDWEDMHVEAKRIIDREIEALWYREQATEHGISWESVGFDDTLVDTAALKRLACYKTLELIYLYLMKDSAEPDAFERQMHLFHDLYVEEFQKILSLGLGYDWDSSGAIDSDEKLAPQMRRLHRM